MKTLTVRELIERLQKLPQDLPVAQYDADTEEYFPVTDAVEVSRAFHFARFPGQKVFVTFEN